MSETRRLITFEDFSDNVDSPYRLVLLASRRAKDIIREAKVQGKILEMKPTELALRNILRYGIEGIPTQPPAEPVASEETEDSEPA